MMKPNDLPQNEPLGKLFPTGSQLPTSYSVPSPPPPPEVEESRNTAKTLRVSLCFFALAARLQYGTVVCTPTTVVSALHLTICR